MICSRLPALLFLLLVGCADGEVDDMVQRKGPPPWHLWGDTKNVVVEMSLLSLEYQTQQLVRISYGRPETWDFMFGARIINFDPDDTAGEIEVFFDVTVGVGRSQFTMPGFEHFMWFWTVAPSPLNQPLYSTEVIAPQRIPMPPAVAPVDNRIGEITAQDIQVSARVLYTGGVVVPKRATVEVTSFWAPRAHIRPEWWKGEFPGGEDNGQ